MAKPSPKLCAAASLPLLGGLLWLLAVWLISPTLPSLAQFTPTTPLQFVTADPAGACTANSPLRYNTSNGKLWGCDALVWTAISGSGGSYAPNTGVSTNRTAALGTPVALHTTGNCCTTFAATNSWTSETWVQFGPTSQIRQAGDITSLRFSWANPASTPQISSVVFQLWRNNPSNASSTNAWNTPANLVMIAQSENIFSSLTNGAINTVTLATPIHAQVGDFYGFTITGTFTPGNHPDDRFFYSALSGEAVYVTVGTVGTYPTQPTFVLNAGWGVASSIIPVDVIMSTAPVFVMMGDSISLGSTRYPTSSGSNEAQNFPDPASQPSYYLSRYTGWTGQNAGIGGQTTAQISARFATDVVAHSPRVVVINGGLNDIFNSVSLATFQANWTSMLTAARAASIVPVCLLITPWNSTNGTLARSQTKDTWNQWLTGQCEQYGGYTVDPQPYLGKFRTGGTTGNLWDIRPEFLNNSDGLGVHLRPEGAKQLAQSVIDRLGALPSGNVMPRQSAFGTQAFLSQTASISTTNIQCYDQANAPIDVCEPGMYRVSIYMLVNTLGAGATVAGTFGWNDPSNTSGGTLRSAALPSLDASALNYLSQQYTVALGFNSQFANNENLTFSTVLAGGSATYSVYITAERIGGIGY